MVWSRGGGCQDLEGWGGRGKDEGAERSPEWGVIRSTTEGSRCPTEGQQAPSQQEHQEGVSAGIVPLALMPLSPHLPPSGIWFPPLPEAPCKTAHPPGPFYLSRVGWCGTSSPTPAHAWRSPVTHQQDRGGAGGGRGIKCPNPGGAQQPPGTQWTSYDTSS